MSLQIVSADSHVMEPAELWMERLDRRYRDKAPRVVKNENAPGYSFVAPGVNPWPVAAGFGFSKSGQELKEHMTKGYEAARPSGWDPIERIRDQDIDGVAAEVMYSTLGMRLFSLDDIELQQACFAAFNDWVAEFASHSPHRLYAVALISLEDVGEGVKELQRVVKKGLCGAMICGVPSRSYDSAIYDPFWTAAQDLDLPVSIHLSATKSQPKLEIGAGMALRTMEFITEIQQSLSGMIFGRVFERFPKLKIVSAENDCGWIGHYMYRIDIAYETLHTIAEKNLLEMKPSEFIRRNVWATFIDDPLGPLTAAYFGDDHFMWGSDFPHIASSWPNSRRVIEENLQSVSDTVKRQIVCDNAVKLYRMQLN